jgi:hypothetical protein
MKFVVEGFPAPVAGIMTNEDTTFVYLKGEKDTWRLPKGKICGFAPMDFEPLDYLPFHILYCENKNMDCPGVQFIKEGAGFSQKDLEIFMGPCSCKTNECLRGSRGEVRSVSGAFLKKMLNGMLFGEYPEKKGARNGNKRTDKETGNGKSKSRVPVEREEPTDGGTGQPQEAAE